MAYVDLYIAAVPKANRDAYIAHATMAAHSFKRHGAQDVVECWGDDIPTGELTSFPFAVKCGADEDVVAGWVVWPSKAARDAGMPNVMQDLEADGSDMPFDGKRLIFGGFERILAV